MPMAAAQAWLARSSRFSGCSSTRSFSSTVRITPSAMRSVMGVLRSPMK